MFTIVKFTIVKFSIVNRLTGEFSKVNLSDIQANPGVTSGYNRDWRANFISVWAE